jgi:hypothetical protein
LAALPEYLRPGRFRDSDDVGVYAFKLMSRTGVASNSHIFVRMATFFAAASQRLSQILAVASEEKVRMRSQEDVGR